MVLLIIIIIKQQLNVKINKNNDADNKKLKQKLHQAELVCCTVGTCGRNELHD